MIRILIKTQKVIVTYVVY